MIEIDSGISQTAPAPRSKAKKGRAIIRTPKNVQAAMEAYAAAYRAVYELPPNISFDGTWVRVHGQREGVTLKRLKEMTTQLRYRAG